MIFYFTGTGNSRWVAEALGTAFDEPLVSIADALNEGKNAYPLGEREKVFFVFPVHSWGPAVLVPRFISRLILSGYKGFISSVLVVMIVDIRIGSCGASWRGGELP